MYHINVSFLVSVIVLWFYKLLTLEEAGDGCNIFATFQLKVSLQLLQNKMIPVLSYNETSFVGTTQE